MEGTYGSRFEFAAAGAEAYWDEALKLSPVRALIFQAAVGQKNNDNSRSPCNLYFLWLHLR
jgi:hypothetical protein